MRSDKGGRQDGRHLAVKRLYLTRFGHQVYLAVSPDEPHEQHVIAASAFLPVLAGAYQSCPAAIDSHVTD